MTGAGCFPPDSLDAAAGIAGLGAGGREWLWETEVRVRGRGRKSDRGRGGKRSGCGATYVSHTTLSQANASLSPCLVP